jgi:hypothetical protein
MIIPSDLSNLGSIFSRHLVGNVLLWFVRMFFVFPRVVCCRLLEFDQLCLSRKICAIILVNMFLVWRQSFGNFSKGVLWNGDKITVFIFSREFWSCFHFCNSAWCVYIMFVDLKPMLTWMQSTLYYLWLFFDSCVQYWVNLTCEMIWQKLDYLCYEVSSVIYALIV